MADIKLYGHNQTRPGTDPPEWVGVQKWWPRWIDAMDDAGYAKVVTPGCQHRIDIQRIKINEDTQ